MKEEEKKTKKGKPGHFDDKASNPVVNKKPHVSDGSTTNRQETIVPGKPALQEEETLKFWKEKNIFEKTLAKESPKGEFVFYEGPPTANARPGIHHLEPRAFKDIILRFKTMQGYHVRRKGGWDTHGLPVELEVEKKLGFKSKKDIEEYGIEAFNKKCQETVQQYTSEWQKFTDRVGYWVDQEDAYVTYENKYIESVWHILKKTDEQKLLYKDYKVLPWCPRCGTALSSHELAQGYKEVTDESVYVKFEMVLEPGVFFLVWTTTPWTLPSNLAIAIGKDISYSRGVYEGVTYIIASNKKDLFGEAFEVKKEMKGSDLVGKKYKPLFDFIPATEKTHKIYEADFVSIEEGTGMVHIAPMYGIDDFTLGTKEDLPKKHLVGEDGKFLPEAGEFNGIFFKNADEKVILDLEGRGLLFKKEPATHTYPFCWRCQTPLIYYARDSWYIKMSHLRDKLISENEKINWEPENIKEGRFGEWLREVKDWAISRERYWGTPLPIWITEGGEYQVIGSMEELKRKIGSQNKYLLMRHGEAENNTTGIISDRKENPHNLTEKGKEEVIKTAKKLKNEKIDLIVSSPFLRTVETAKLVAEAVGLKKGDVRIDNRLGELNTGELNLHPVNEYHKLFTKTVEKFTKAPEGGETLSDVKKRIGGLLYELEEKEKGKKILLITHEYPAWLMTTVTEAWTDKEAALRKDKTEDFILSAECRELPFISLPHDEDYNPDMHRPYIDKIIFTEKGKEFKRVPEVLDVWFDSGAMPFAQDHYPFENKEWLDGQGFPADFISEAIDQTRGWFYTLHAVGVLMGKGHAYRNVICLGHILDKNGKKMSKSLGNTADPWQMMDKYSADVLRMWMYTVNQPGESKNFDEATVAELSRKTSGLLVNILSFYQMYAGETVPKEFSPEVSDPLDRWLVALSEKLIRDVNSSLMEYQVLIAGRAIRDFIGEFSQWYIRRSRNHFKSEDERERRGALETTGFALLSLSKLLAPFMPFLAEHLYQSITLRKKKESVHLENWPEVGHFDESVLGEMETVRKIVEVAHALRAKEKIKIRQPLNCLSYELVDKKVSLSPEMERIIADEINVKKVTATIMVTSENTEGVNPVRESKSEEFSNGVKVELDFKLTPELIKEGALREMTRAIQELRKEKGLKPGEEAVLSFSGNKEAVFLLKEGMTNIIKTTSLSRVDFIEKEKEEKTDGEFRYSISL